MGITYEVDASLGIVFGHWLGVVTAKDLADHWNLMSSDKQAMACGRSLADVRECEFQFTGAELAHLVKIIVEPALQDRGWKSAILVQKPLQYGVARQYQVFAEMYSKVAVFSEESAAREWIGL